MVALTWNHNQAMTQLAHYEQAGWINSFSNGALQSGRTFYDITDVKERGYRFTLIELNAYLHGLRTAERAVGRVLARKVVDD